MAISIETNHVTKNGVDRKERMAAYKSMGKYFLWSGWAVALGAAALGGYIVDKMNGRLDELKGRNKDLAITLSLQNNPIHSLMESIAVIPMRGEETRKTAEGKLFLTGDPQRMILIAKNLPIPSDGKIYKLWLVKNGETVLAGSMSLDPSGAGMLDFRSAEPLKTFQAATLGLEAADAKAPTGETFLAARF